jgi:glycosyltransferase involved in cell wall biosynthesis
VSAPERLRICYVAPGQDLVSTMGPTRNVLNLARALQAWADVTVAFRRTVDPPPSDIQVREIEPQARSRRADDAATSGMGYLQFLDYWRTVRRFAREQLREYDIVLEKSWLLSGDVAAFCSGRGQLGVPVENIVQNPEHAAREQWAKLMRLKLGAWVARRNMRRVPLVIAETEFLKREIERHWQVPAGRIAVVNLGVDKSLFRPVDQREARERLGLSADATILTYVGVLDWTHDLEPAIRALVAERLPRVELHVVGDGARRGDYEAMALDCPAVRFHGKRPHDEVPWHIAGADLCLAPYDAAAFASGELGYSTMKIPEYLSVGRAVVSVPSGRIRSLVTDGSSGFLFANEPARWREFLHALPDRAELARMGAAAAATPQPDWAATARAYLDLCVGALAERRTGAPA